MGGGSGSGSGSQASMRHLTNIFRRVYRIFAHAWFQHRGVFWQVEGYEGLYVFFKTVCDVYQLIPEDNYTIPTEAEGGEGETTETPVGRKSPETGKMSLLLKKKSETGNGTAGQHDGGEITSNTDTAAATTRRHKHNPSTGSHVTTIAEGREEEEGEEEEEDDGDEGNEDDDDDDEHEEQSNEGSVLNLSKPGENEYTTRSVDRSCDEPSRGRRGLSGEGKLVTGLGKLSLGNLANTAAAKADTPSEIPTPQPQGKVKDPMDSALARDEKDVSDVSSDTAPGILTPESEKETEPEPEKEKEKEKGKGKEKEPEKKQEAETKEAREPEKEKTKRTEEIEDPSSQTRKPSLRSEKTIKATKTDDGMNKDTDTDLVSAKAADVSSTPPQPSSADTGSNPDADSAVDVDKDANTTAIASADIKSQADE
jgi:hypothetical protein